MRERWRLVLGLACIGPAMGGLTLAGVTHQPLGGVPRELWCWLAAGVLTATYLARTVDRPLSWGALAGALMALGASATQAAFVDVYLGHEVYAAQFAEVENPRLMILGMAPVIAVIWGAAIGALTWSAHRFRGKASLRD